MISALKDLFEDLKRHRSDNEENSRKATVYIQNEGWKEVFWKEIQVGQLVKLTKD